MALKKASLIYVHLSARHLRAICEEEICVGDDNGIVASIRGMVQLDWTHQRRVRRSEVSQQFRQERVYRKRTKKNLDKRAW